MKREVVKEISVKGVVSKPYPMVVDWNTSPAELVEAGRYNSVDPLVVKAADQWRIKHVTHYDAYLVRVEQENDSQLEVVLALMNSAGIHPANPLDLLYFGVKYRKVCANKFVAAASKIAISDYDGYRIVSESCGHRQPSEDHYKKTWTENDRHRHYFLASINGFQRERNIQMLYGYHYLDTHCCWGHGVWFLGFKFR